MIFKPSVRMAEKDQGRLQQILNVAEVCFHYCGYRPVATSILDGEHSTDSLHHKYRAIDFRTRNIPELDVLGIRDLMSSVLGPDFDVVIEITHIHVEYDPFRE